MLLVGTCRALPFPGDLEQFGFAEIAADELNRQRQTARRNSSHHRERRVNGAAGRLGPPPSAAAASAGASRTTVQVSGSTGISEWPVPGRPDDPLAWPGMAHKGRARQVGLPGTNVGRGAETRRSDRVSRCQSAGAAEGVVGSMEAIMQNAPWNKGRLTGQKRPLRPKDVWAIRVRLQLKRRARDLALFNLAIDSKLRGCNLVRLQVDDVCAGGRVRDRATIIQKKTGRPVQFEITEQTRASIRAWLPEVEARNGQYVFPSRFRTQPHLSTRQYTRIVHAWVESAGLTAPPVARTRCGGRRRPRSIRRRVT